jgi:hypothetical protein
MFSDVGERFGVSSSTAAAFGVAAVIVPVVFLWAIISTRSSMRRKKARAPKIVYHREGEYEASQPPPPSTNVSQESPPPISPPGGPSILGVGIHQGAPSLPSALDLRATWENDQVELIWDRPLFDENRYRLDGYVVSKMQYGPRGTAPEKVQLAGLSSQETEWRSPFTQTYRWNTGGDIESFVVDAILRQVSSTGQEGITRIGGIVYVPP